MIPESYALYQPIPEEHGKGMYFYTSCCRNTMYSINNDENAYHGCLCPKCNMKGKWVTLYKVNSKEAEEKRKEGLLIEYGR